MRLNQGRDSRSWGKMGNAGARMEDRVRILESNSRLTMYGNPDRFATARFLRKETYSFNVKATRPATKTLTTMRANIALLPRMHLVFHGVLNKEILCADKDDRES